MALLGRRRRVKRSATEITASLADCRALLHLAAEIQQHRGLSSTWLSGNSSFEAKVRARRHCIEQQFPVLREIVNREELHAVPCITSNEWRLFQFHWRELCEGLAGFSPEQSFTLHSRLVQKLLAWLEALGEARIALGRRRQVPPEVVRNVFQRLPMLSEVLGQARAIGSAVAVRGNCSPVARVRLLFLVSKAEALLAQVHRSLPKMAEQEEACRAVEHMAQTIRHGILARSGTIVAADQYFAIASSAIDAVYDWIYCMADKIGADAAPLRDRPLKDFAVEAGATH
jgi:hypothetical protein